eukprot:NODE_1632_length_1108_cov_35.788480_g1333_i0.p1 GENE.NODE_1632_length_1108_cov_35.788480_g1333_i0~~NODE_1632_length_1108_cov_35.788480_g1333_i0.p1  ORF type:complete len:269 (+),score=81.45 NODE_1632_length_1108_cov_35.788480_g1333_i0:288-1094(+)
MDRILSSTSNSSGVVGLDAEWNRSLLAVLQLATDTDVFVIHLVHFRGQNGGGLSPLVRLMLGDPNIPKVGVGIENDVGRILNEFQLEVKGWLDLRSIVHKHSSGLVGGLKDMARTFLNLEMQKTMQQSNWEVESLSMRQRKYAALDAAVGANLALQLFLELGFGNILDWLRPFMGQPYPPSRPRAPPLSKTPFQELVEWCTQNGLARPKAEYSEGGPQQWMSIIHVGNEKWSTSGWFPSRNSAKHDAAALCLAELRTRIAVPTPMADM